MTTTKKSKPSAEDVKKGNGRLTFQEAMSLVALPNSSTTTSTSPSAHKNGNKATGKQTGTTPRGRTDVNRRYMSRRKVWVTGDDIVTLAVDAGAGSFRTGTSAYGGHVYSQAALAASMAFRASQREKGEGVDDQGNSKGKNFGIHTIHGFFSEAGRDDRPFIYEVTTLASNPLFPNLLVTARQPAVPSTKPEQDFYPLADADLPLGPVCFSAMVSFRPEGVPQLDAQEPPAQERYRDVLQTRRPVDWDPAPVTDIDGLLALIPGARKAVGMFPGLEMRKVDMTAYNKGKPIHERREIVLYRLLAPLPDSSLSASASVNAEGREKNKKKSEEDTELEINGPDAHICAHAFGADRNGLLMIGNHAGYGSELARAASLSYSFVVHVDAADAVMTYRRDDDDNNNNENENDNDEVNGDDSSDKKEEKSDKNQKSENNNNMRSYALGEWWIQETSFPRLRTGRGIVYSKIWSPRGVHVATEYQDGIIRRKPRPGDRVAVRERREAFKL